MFFIERLSMHIKIEEVLNLFKKDLENNNLNLIELRNKYLSKKGLVSSLMLEIRNVEPSEKPNFGKDVNFVKDEILLKITSLEQQEADLANKQKALSEKYDINFPGEKINIGTRHPLTIINNRIIEFFQNNGFEIIEGPEIETDYYNFEMMNIPPSHPARAMHDSLYFNPTTLLRTHTSPVQARVMLERKGQSIKVFSPGKVYRRDEEDARHSHQFMQGEVLVIGPEVNFLSLKETILSLLRYLFGDEVDIRIRPSYFPFTEPSIEVDMLIKDKNGIKKYVEILGAGMVHPNVLKMGGYNPEKVQGFAFGIGIERVAMRFFEIDDIRNFYTNDFRFLNCFKEGL